MQIKEYLKEHKIEFEPWLVRNEQGRVDVKILPYLQDIENGVFVEAGAMDGLFQSNTKVLEDLGWKGVLVEPSPSACVRCDKNRDSPVYQCCLVSDTYKGEWIRGDFFFDGYMGNGAYSSIGRSFYKPDGFQFFDVGVLASTLDSVLSLEKIDKVDFLSLDVEGYELEVLKGIDFKRTPIKYMLIEVNTREYSLKATEAYLKPFGYAEGINLSGFTKEKMPLWSGDHQDYLFICNS